MLFRSLRSIFDTTTMVKMRTAQFGDHPAVDCFGNKTIVTKTRGPEGLGSKYKVTNLNFKRPKDEPDQIKNFGHDENPLYCRCGAEISEECFNPGENLKRGNLYGRCTSCEQTWRIDFKVRTNSQNITMSAIYELWEHGSDIFPSLECHLFFD